MPLPISQYDISIYLYISTSTGDGQSHIEVLTTRVGTRAPTMDSNSNGSFARVTSSALSLLGALLSLQLLLDLSNRALVVQCGEWYARTSTVLAVLPLSLLGAVAAVKFPARQFHRMLAWIAVGVFGFLDLVYVTEKLSDAIFGHLQAQTLSDVGILKRSVFIGAGACWIPSVCLGYLMWSYAERVIADAEAGGRGHGVGNATPSASTTALVWAGMHAACAGMLLWDVPMWALASYAPYPDCLVPLVGVGVACFALVIELRAQQFGVLGGAVVVVGISLAFNAFLSCRYCGYVDSEGRRGGHTGGVTTVWKCPLPAGGILQVIDVDVVFQQDDAIADESYRLRAVRLGHSIMGGEWTAPASVAGLPIFSAFHLQAAAGALFSSAVRGSRGNVIEPTDDSGKENPLGSSGARDQPNRRSLHVGLGIGGSVTLLQKLGFACDCIELHPQMVHVAKEFFHLNSTVCQIGDANALITNRHPAGLPLDAYDVIIVDIFSGDANAVSRSGNKDFFAAISRASMANSASSQVLVVNYFGLQGVQLNNLHNSISQSFSTVNVYREEAMGDDEAADADHAISNFILVASNAPPTGTAPEHPARLLVSEPYSAVFAEYKDHIVEVLEHRRVTDLKSTCDDVSSVVSLARHWLCHGREQLLFSGAHWRAMRGQFFVG